MLSNRDRVCAPRRSYLSCPKYRISGYKPSRWSPSSCYLYRKEVTRAKKYATLYRKTTMARAEWPTLKFISTTWCFCRKIFPRKNIAFRNWSKSNDLLMKKECGGDWQIWSMHQLYIQIYFTIYKIQKIFSNVLPLSFGIYSNNCNNFSKISKEFHLLPLKKAKFVENKICKVSATNFVGRSNSSKNDVIY